MVSITATGDGTGALRVMGFDAPWPVYAECTITPSSSSVQIDCPFTKPDDKSDLEIMIISSSPKLDMSITEIRIEKKP
jgi:hypothetical protein